MTQPRAGGTLDPCPAHAIEQLVLCDLKQPAGCRPTFGIEPGKVGYQRSERLSRQVKRQLARTRTAHVIPGYDRQPSPIERGKGAIVPVRRSQQ